MENKRIYKYALDSYYKLKNIVDTFKGTLEELCDKLYGHNFEDGLFDVNFEWICGTVKEEGNKLVLVDNIEIWNDSTYEFVGTFDIEWLEKQLLVENTTEKFNGGNYEIRRYD